jgi:hypothetical protein
VGSGLGRSNIGQRASGRCTGRRSPARTVSLALPIRAGIIASIRFAGRNSSTDSIARPFRFPSGPLTGSA